MNLNDICHNYFHIWQNKDLSALKELFCSDITLRDWVIGEVVGRDEVLKANEGIFQSVEKIEVTVHDIHATESSAACEISIQLDSESLLVCDVITVNEMGKIQSIRAYKG